MLKKRKRYLNASKRSERDLRIVPAAELVQIVNDAEDRRYRNLVINSENLRMELSSVVGNKAFQELKSKNESIIFDASFDHFVIRKPMRRKASADISVVVNADQIDGKVLIINLTVTVSADITSNVINYQIDEVLSDYALLYASGIIKGLHTKKFGVTEDIVIPKHISELKANEKMHYDGYRIKYSFSSLEKETPQRTNKEDTPFANEVVLPTIVNR